MLNKKRFRLALIWIATASTLFAWTEASCSDYNLNTNGIDFCYDVNTPYLLPWNTTTNDVPRQFNANGNFTTSMNFIGNTTNMYGTNYYNMYGRRNGTMQKLYSQGNQYNRLYTYTGACLWSIENITEYGVREFSCWEYNNHATYITNENIANLQIRWNINMIIVSRADNRAKFCFVSEYTTQVLCYWVWPEEEITAPAGITTPYNATNIWSNFFTTNPFINNWWWNGTGNTTMNTNTYLCPTIQQLIDTYDTNIYNVDLCYSSSLIYSWWTINRITPKTMEELYPTYTWFYQDMIAYDTYCRQPYNNETCRSIFTWKEIEYTLIAKIPTNVHASKVYQYCHLQTLPNKNASTCIASWTIAEWIIATGTTAETWQIQINSQRMIQELTNWQATLITPQWITIINLTGNTTTTTWNNIYSDIIDLNNYNGRDIIGSLKSMYNKLSWLFYARNGVDGIIPDYITRILLIIVLFALRKK